MIFHRNQQAQLIDYITRWWRDSDKPLEVKRVEPGRTVDQQAKLHALISEIAISAGVGPDWFKQSFLKRDCEGIWPYWPTKLERNRQGDKVAVPKSEAKLTKREESELIERLYVLGAEWGVEFKEETAA